MKVPKRLRWLLFFPFCLAADAVWSVPLGKNGPTVQDILKKWTAVEWAFLDAENGGSVESILLHLDDFQDGVNVFLSSDIYRLYRYSPIFKRKDMSVFETTEPNEIKEVQYIADHIPAFREALLRGERKNARALAIDIFDSLVRWQELDWGVGQFVNTAYFELFLILFGFIAVMAPAVWLLYRALLRSWDREKAGSFFARALVLAHETERSRISRELHDSVAQDLRYLALRVGKISRTQAQAERVKLCEEVAQAQEALIIRVRDICEGLGPQDFRSQGLPDALRRLCHDFGRQTGIDCRINIVENLRLDLLDEEKQLQVYRIVQEALTNIKKHAEAGEAVVVMRMNNGGGYISVSDDGKGFSPDSPAGKRFRDNGGAGKRTEVHLGIRGMYERAAILGGNLSIESNGPGEGVTVQLIIPLEARDG